MKAITIKGEHNMTKRGRCYGFTILLVFALILGGCGGNTASNKAANEKDFKPSKAIEVVAPAGAGGGWDTTARTISKIMGEEKLIEKMAVVNKPGAVERPDGRMSTAKKAIIIRCLLHHRRFCSCL